MTVPLWTRGDLNAFFGLGINMLVNVLVLAGLTIGVVGLGADDVYQTILPAVGLGLLVGNLFYFWLAVRLAKREGRTDVTAMPYGPSVTSSTNAMVPAANIAAPSRRGPTRSCTPSA